MVTPNALEEEEEEEAASLSFTAPDALLYPPLANRLRIFVKPFLHMHISASYLIFGLFI